MKQLALICALLAPATALAEERNPSLAEIMPGATAMANIATGYLFVAQETEAWVCAINITSKHFAALIEGDKVVAEETTPSTVCVPAAHFENAME